MPNPVPQLTDAEKAAAREQARQQMRRQFPEIAAIVDELRKTETMLNGKVYQAATDESVKIRCIKSIDGVVLIGKEPEPDPEGFTMSAEALASVFRYYDIMKIKPAQVFERPRYGKRF